MPEGAFSDVGAYIVFFTLRLRKMTQERDVWLDLITKTRLCKYMEILHQKLKVFR